MRIRPNMNIEQKCLAVLDEAVGVSQIGIALADGLDLGPPQCHAGLELLQKEVVMAGSTVLRGISFPGGDRVARLSWLLRPRPVRLYDNVACLSGHRSASLNFHPSIGAANPHIVVGLC